MINIRTRRQIAEAATNKMQTIKVWPATDDKRKVLRHANGTGFRDSMDEPALWPNDTFTARRIRDGDILTEEMRSGGQRAEPAPVPAPKKPKDT